MPGRRLEPADFGKPGVSMKTLAMALLALGELREMESLLDVARDGTAPVSRAVAEAHPFGRKNRPHLRGIQSRRSERSGLLMMERQRAKVVIGQRMLPVGELFFETDGRRQSSMFRYSRDWLAYPERFPLSPSMPLSETPFHRSGGRENPRDALPGPVGDGAPDSWGRGILRKAMGRPLTEIELLLAADDATRQGTLRYLDEDGRALSRDAPPVPPLVGLERLAGLSRLYERDPEMGKRELREIAGHAGSLGGARPKANLDDDGALSIARFTSERDTKAIERMEVATLGLARAAGINACQARLALSGTPCPVALVARFDRRNGERIPYLSALSLMGDDATAGGFYTDLADMMRAYCVDHRTQLEELHRRIMFTILVSNNDDHLKNYGFLYAGERKWALSPAFNVNPQPERHRHLETGISESSGNEASIEAALEAQKARRLATRSHAVGTHSATGA